MGSKWANDVTFVVFSHNSAIYADDVARVITSRTMTASGAELPMQLHANYAGSCPTAAVQCCGNPGSSGKPPLARHFRCSLY
jgi:hypothetical protein